MIKFCPLYSGSTGNCLFFSDKKSSILVDIGVSTKKVVEGLSKIDEKPSDIKGIIITHEHSDHVKGLNVFIKNYNTPVYVKYNAWQIIKKDINADNVNVNFIDDNNEFYIDDIFIKAFSVPHDAQEPVGYSIISNKKKITIATDVGHINHEIKENISGSDLLMIESNHDENIVKASKYPLSLKRRIMSDMGHLSNDSAGFLISEFAKKGMNNFILGHLSKNNNFPELAYQTVKNHLDSTGIKLKNDIQMNVTNCMMMRKVFHI